MKKCFLSFVLGALIFSTVGVYAAGGNMIEVFYNINKLVVNGVEKTSEEKPFTYNGTTYLPARLVSESLGYEVNWDRETGTLYIGEKPAPNVAYPGKDIEAITTQNDIQSKLYYNYMGDNLEDNLNKCYNSYIAYVNNFFSSKGYIEFPTNGQYNKFEAMLGMCKEYKNTTTETSFNVYADDELIYNDVIKAGDMPKKISIDIKNSIKVKFEFIPKNNGNIPGDADNKIALFNPRFIK